MKPLKFAMLGIRTAVLAFGLQGANASENREHEREGWVALARIQVDGTEAHAPQASAAYEPISGDCMPFEQSLLDRGSLGLPEHVLVPQMGGLLSYLSGEESESPSATDRSFIASAP
jgi:hypothetical protein